MARPVFDHELRSIQGASLLGSCFFGLACLTVGAWINYSIALSTSGLTMTPELHADYVALLFASKLLTLFFGAPALLAHLKAWWDIRGITSKAESVFVWSEMDKTYVRAKVPTTPPLAQLPPP
jgi:hypothetical protein